MGAEKVLVAMSGGVDSSVAALLALKSGFDCAGATMRLFANKKAGVERLCGEQDGSQDAASAAFRLGVPFFVFDFAEEFKKDVVERFVLAYRAGVTPNPCVLCNRRLKFGRFLRRAKELGYSKIATGHYAVIKHDEASGRFFLKKGTDKTKDQSYVLYSLTQEQLSSVIFPLGETTKERVREIAASVGLANAGKRESQDICFVPDGDYAAFIERFSKEPDAAGNFVDETGRVIARHKGFSRYTIGQRRGLGLSLREPLYVLEKRARDAAVILGKEDKLFSRSLTASDVNFIACGEIPRPMRVCAKIRYRQQESPATAEQISDDKIRVEFDEPQRAVTPGQAVVLYDGDIVIGGGTID